MLADCHKEPLAIRKLDMSRSRFRGSIRLTPYDISVLMEHSKGVVI
jgi:hypothetical protein